MNSLVVMVIAINGDQYIHTQPKINNSMDHLRSLITNKLNFKMTGLHGTLQGLTKYFPQQDSDVKFALMF